MTSVTFQISGPGDKIRAAASNHGLNTGDSITFSTDGTLPTNMSTATTYYAFVQGGDTQHFFFSTSSDVSELGDCLGGATPIGGSGSHTFSAGGGGGGGGGGGSGKFAIKGTGIFKISGTGKITIK